MKPCPVHPHHTGHEILTIGLSLMEGMTREERYANWALERGSVCVCDHPEILHLRKELEETRAVLKDLMEEKGLRNPVHTAEQKQRIFTMLHHVLLTENEHQNRVYVNAVMKLVEQL